VATQQPAAITVMDIGFFGAVATYSAGWVLGRRRSPGGDKGLTGGAT
jgi:hypothetical protein